MKIIVMFVSLVLASAASFAATALSYNGEAAVLSQYLDDDLFVLTDGPVIQAGIYVEMSKKCSIDLWTNQGLDTRVGAEIDIGVSCRQEIGDTEVEVSVERYFLGGSDDITGLNVSVTRGQLDLTISRYLWDNNPDATRIILGYSLEADAKLTFRPSLGYETGFGERSIYVFGLGAEYALTEDWFLVGTVLTPISKGPDDERSTEVVVGFMFTF